MFIRSLTFVCIVALAVGCSPDRKPRKVPRDLANFATLDDSDVIVRIGTNELKKADLEALADIRLAMSEYAARQSGRKGKINRFSLLAPLVANAPTSFRAQTAWLTWAATNGVSVGKDDLREYQNRYMKSFGVRNGDFKTFAKSFGEKQRKAIRERIRVEATIDCAHKSYFRRHPVELSQGQVDEFISKVKAYNEVAAQTNALIWAKATNLCERIQKGEDFGKLADEYSEDEAKSEQGGWGAFRMSDLANDGELDKTVAALSVGEVSKPIEADNGLNVIKLVSIIDVQGNPVDKGSQLDVRYDLARIFLKLPEIYDLPSVEETKREMKQYLEQKALAEFVQALMASDGVVYPLGEAMFKTAREQMRMPMFVQQQGVTDETFKK